MRLPGRLSTFDEVGIPIVTLLGTCRGLIVARGSVSPLVPESVRTAVEALDQKLCGVAVAQPSAIVQ